MALLNKRRSWRLSEYRWRNELARRGEGRCVLCCRRRDSDSGVELLGGRDDDPFD
jgi:hypothetical protein